MHDTLPIAFVHPTLLSPAATSDCVWFAMLAVMRLSPLRQTVGSAMSHDCGLVLEILKVFI